MFLFLFLFFSLLLPCLFLRLKQEPILIKIIISSEQRLNYVAAFFLFFFFRKMPKIWVGQMTLNREKKRMALSLSLSLSFNLIKNQFF